MSQISHHRMSLFDAPPGALLVHACNCRGNWGSGIAAEFRRRYPDAHEAHRAEGVRGELRRGGAALYAFAGEPHAVGCLMTSVDYGARRDSVSQILQATETAARALLSQALLVGYEEVWSPKINAGLFGVPWRDTEAVLVKVLAEFPGMSWRVCELGPSSAAGDGEGK